jgi:hypothetical protein
MITETLYINSAASLLEKIDRIDAIIAALLIQAGTAAEDSNVEEYMLDDSQVKIKTIFRDPMSIADAILKFTQLRNRCLNQLNGATMVVKSRRGLY